MALPYRRADVKARAREQWSGACNVTLPSFDASFAGLNDAGIAHDVTRAADLGYWGTLIASECGTTLTEYERFLRVAADAAPPSFRLVAHLSFDTAREMAQAARAAEDVGAEAALVCYPPTFRPQSAADIVDFTRQLAESTDLALILFAVPTWGYRPLHATGFPVDALAELAKLETAAALKYEGGGPASMSAFDEMFHRCGHDVIVENPMEFNTPALVRNYGIRWFGTSCYEALGDRPVRVLRSASADDFDSAMAVFWSSQPAREASAQFHASFAGAHLLHRNGWKYLSWLQGFNGGLLRMPQMRLHPTQMSALRAGVVAAGFDAPSDDAGYWSGRTG